MIMWNCSVPGQKRGSGYRKFCKTKQGNEACLRGVVNRALWMK